MKTAFLLVLALGVGFAAGSFFISKHQAARHADALAAWEKEKAALQDDLEAARRRVPDQVIVPNAPIVTPVSVQRQPEEIMATLQALRGNNARTLREAVYWLVELAHAGPAALPVIREFLGRNQDIDLDTAGAALGKTWREVPPPDFAVPPSLRFGLFSVLRQIGGPEAEQILAETLVRTGRGVEVSYLARVLQQIAPDKYRDQALSVARELLTSNTPLNSANPLDRAHRVSLFALLGLYNDTSFAATAQTQLVQGDGQLDRDALKYVQQSLGAQAVPIAAQLYQDPRLSDSARKEPLARLALTYVGADSQANDFYQRAINDPVMSPKDRKNLIEDLNEDGLNFKNLTAQDLPLIQSRLALIDQLAPSAMDKVNASAFQEARKDLINMISRLNAPK